VVSSLDWREQQQDVRLIINSRAAAQGSHKIPLAAAGNLRGGRTDSAPANGERAPSDSAAPVDATWTPPRTRPLA
jgi:hypothetical protein